MAYGNPFGREVSELSAMMFAPCPGEDQIMPPPIHRRSAHNAITTKQKFRPLFFSDISPNTAPTPAIRIVNQFNHPSKGMKPTIARTSATRPKRNAMMFAMNDLWRVFDEGASRSRQFGRILPPLVARPQQPIPILICCATGVHAESWKYAWSKNERGDRR